MIAVSPGKALQYGHDKQKWQLNLIWFFTKKANLLVMLGIHEGVHEGIQEGIQEDTTMNKKVARL